MTYMNISVATMTEKKSRALGVEVEESCGNVFCKKNREIVTRDNWFKCP